MKNRVLMRIFLIIGLLLITNCKPETAQERALRKAKELQQKYGRVAPQEQPDSITVETITIHDKCDSIAAAYQQLLETKCDSVVHDTIYQPANFVIPTVKTKKVANTKKKNKSVPVKTEPKVDKPTEATHIVSKKETIYSISKKYGVSPDVIRKANNIKSNNLKVGQRLRIPF